MKYQSTVPMGQTRTLADIRKALLKEFQKSKSESQCITEMKEIKQLSNESVWDFDQRFKILKDRLAFQIPDEKHREWFIAGLLSTYTLPFDTTEDYVTVRSPRDFYEVGSIPCRREWCRDGSGSVTVSNIDYSVARAC
jgi:hypothetical protein